MFRYFCIIPYIGLPSHLLAKRWKRLTPLYVTFSPTKISSYLSLKNRTDTNWQSGVIYRFKCQVDPDILTSVRLLYIFSDASFNIWNLAADYFFTLKIVSLVTSLRVNASKSSTILHHTSLLVFSKLSISDITLHLQISRFILMVPLFYLTYSHKFISFQ